MKLMETPALSSFRFSSRSADQQMGQNFRLTCWCAPRAQAEASRADAFVSCSLGNAVLRIVKYSSLRRMSLFPVRMQRLLKLGYAWHESACSLLCKCLPLRPAPGTPVHVKPQASRFTVDDATRHMAFEMEILFRKMAPQPFPRGRRLEIVDLKGMTFRDVGSEWFGFAKTVRTSVYWLNQ